MKAEEIEKIKNAAQGMSLNDVVDCINYLEANLRLVENQRDSFEDMCMKAESQLKAEREELIKLIDKDIEENHDFWKLYRNHGSDYSDMYVLGLEKAKILISNIKT